VTDDPSGPGSGIVTIDFGGGFTSLITYTGIETGDSLRAALT